MLVRMFIKSVRKKSKIIFLLVRKQEFSKTIHKILLNQYKEIKSKMDINPYIR